MELGPVEQTIARQAVRNGQPIPDRILNAPELQLGLQLYLNAFFELESERTSNGYGPSPIPWSSMAQYASVFEFTEELRDDLFFHIRAMDHEYLKRVYAKIKTASANAGKGKRKG